MMTRGTSCPQRAGVDADHRNVEEAQRRLYRCLSSKSLQAAQVSTSGPTLF